MAQPKYHTGSRGFPGYEVALTSNAGVTSRTVIPAMIAVDENGNSISTVSGPQPSASSQSVTPANDALFPVVSRGSASIATAQVAVPANTDTLVAAARAGRQKVTVSPTTSAAFYQGAANVSNITGLFVPAGGSKTTDTAAAIYVYSPTAITVSVEELY